MEKELIELVKFLYNHYKKTEENRVRVMKALTQYDDVQDALLEAKEILVLEYPIIKKRCKRSS